jgi:Fe-S cluster biogenesis protein NfuA
MPETLAQRVGEVLDAKVRPYVQSHGGDVHATVTRGAVAVEFAAACGACHLQALTFAATVRPALLAIPGIDSVTCETVPLTAARLDAMAAFFH